MRIKYEELLNKFEDILYRHGFEKEAAHQAALVFAQNSLDGIYSHGVNRFIRIISELDKKAFNPAATLVKTNSFGAIERFDGNQGFGPLNATKAMDRAIELADQYGIGCVALGNNNHWLRGGAYGWQAAKKGMIGICFTNTTANMPAWGGKNTKIGNNPFVVGIPKSDGHCVVLDMAMSLYSYGKVEETRLKDEVLPFPGGYNKNNELSCIPKEIEETGRFLPMGYWKGSGMSIALDLIISILTNSHSTKDISKFDYEIGLCQVFIAIDPTKFNTAEQTDKIVEGIVNDIKSSIPIEDGKSVRYPGERETYVREDNLKNGIPIIDSVWETILKL